MPREATPGDATPAHAESSSDAYGGALEIPQLAFLALVAEMADATHYQWAISDAGSNPAERTKNSGGRALPTPSLL